MKLKTYLDLKRLSITVFAGQIDRDISSVSRLVRGHTKPDWKTLENIVRATDGAVTPNDFLDEQRNAR